MNNQTINYIFNITGNANDVINNIKQNANALNENLSQTLNVFGGINGAFVGFQGVVSTIQSVNDAIGGITQDKAYAKLNNFKPRTIQTDALKTGVFEDNKEGFRRLLSHCYDEDTIRAAMALRKKISKLNFVRDSKLGEGKDMTNPKHRKNLRKKKKRGVLSYHQYKWTTRKGIVYNVKTEVFDGFECLYWMRKRE